jgi:hypothetical protein
MMVLVETAAGTPWTKPDNLPFHAGAPLPKLGGHFTGGFHVLMLTGHVHFARDDFDEATLRRALLSSSQGNWNWEGLFH